MICSLVHRYAWVFEDVTPFAEPIPARGALGLWNWTDTSPASRRDPANGLHLGGGSPGAGPEETRDAGASGGAAVNTEGGIPAAAGQPAKRTK